MSNYLVQAVYDWRRADVRSLALEGDIEKQASDLVEAERHLRRAADMWGRGERCACEVCKGENAGIPGNENIVQTALGRMVMCDNCTAKYLTQREKQ